MLDNLKKKFLDQSFLQDPSDDVVLNLKEEAIASLGRIDDRHHQCIGNIDKSAECSVIWFYELDQLPDGANIYIR